MFSFLFKKQKIEYENKIKFYQEKLSQKEQELKYNSLELEKKDEILYLFSNIVMDNDSKILDEEISDIAVKTRAITKKWNKCDEDRNKKMTDLVEEIKNNAWKKVYGKIYNNFKM